MVVLRVACRATPTTSTRSGQGGPENGYTSVLRAVCAQGALRLAYCWHNPASALPLAAGWAGGRAIDALTGRRSNVAKFVNDNSKPAASGRPRLGRGTRSSTSKPNRPHRSPLSRGRLRPRSSRPSKGRTLRRRRTSSTSSKSRLTSRASCSVRRNSAPRTGSTTTPAWAASTSQFTTRPASVLTTPSLVSSSCSVPGASRQTSSTASSRSPATSWQVTLATTSSTCWTRWPATASSSATPSGRHRLLRRLTLHKLGRLAVSRLCTTRQRTRLRPLAIKPASQRRWIVLLSRITRHTRNRGSTTLLRLSRGPTTAKTPPRSATTSYTRFNTRPRPRPQLDKSWTRWSHRSSTQPPPCGPLPPSVIAVAGPLPESV
jgi:hypothetical protein